jgi:hypothetical protein
MAFEARGKRQEAVAIRELSWQSEKPFSRKLPANFLYNPRRAPPPQAVALNLE